MKVKFRSLRGKTPIKKPRKLFRTFVALTAGLLFFGSAPGCPDTTKKEKSSYQLLEKLDLPTDRQIEDWLLSRY